MKFKDFLESKWLKWVLLSAAIIIGLSFAFGVGTMVGSRRAMFTSRWSENYSRNFAGPRGGFLGDWRGGDFIDAHGVFGQIIKIDDSALIIKGRNNLEKIVVVNDKTTINRLRETIKLVDLKVDDLLVVIGTPNETGQIEARLIRVMPLPPEGMPTSTMPPPPRPWR